MDVRKFGRGLFADCEGLVKFLYGCVWEVSVFSSRIGESL